MVTKETFVHLSNMGDCLARMSQIDNELKELDNQKHELNRKKEFYFKTLENHYPTFVKMVQSLDTFNKDPHLEEQFSLKGIRTENIKDFENKFMKLQSIACRNMPQPTEGFVQASMHKPPKLPDDNYLSGLNNDFPKSFDTQNYKMKTSLQTKDSLQEKYLPHERYSPQSLPQKNHSLKYDGKWKHRNEYESFDVSARSPDQGALKECFSNCSVLTLKENPHWKEAVELQGQMYSCNEFDENIDNRVESDLEFHQHLPYSQQHHQPPNHSFRGDYKLSENSHPHSHPSSQKYQSLQNHHQQHDSFSEVSHSDTLTDESQSCLHPSKAQFAQLKGRTMTSSHSRNTLQTPPRHTPPHQTPPHQTSPHQTSPHHTPPHQTPPHHTPPHKTQPQSRHQAQPRHSAKPRSTFKKPILKTSPRINASSFKRFEQLFTLLDLLEGCERVEDEVGEQKPPDSEYWYRDSNPSSSLKKSIIEAAVKKKAMVPDVTYACVSMVVLSVLKETVKNLADHCLLNDEVISPHYVGFEELSEVLEASKRPLWLRLVQHLNFLLFEKVMTVKKLVSTFVLVLVHPQSCKAIEAENMIIQLLSRQLDKDKKEKEVKFEKLKKHSKRAKMKGKVNKVYMKETKEDREVHDGSENLSESSSAKQNKRRKTLRYHSKKTDKRCYEKAKHSKAPKESPSSSLSHPPKQPSTASPHQSYRSVTTSAHSSNQSIKSYPSKQSMASSSHHSKQSLTSQHSSKSFKPSSSSSISFFKLNSSSKSPSASPSTPHSPPASMEPVVATTFNDRANDKLERDTREEIFPMIVTTLENKLNGCYKDNFDRLTNNERERFFGAQDSKQPVVSSADDLINNVCASDEENNNMNRSFFSFQHLKQQQLQQQKKQQQHYNDDPFDKNNITPTKVVKHSAHNSTKAAENRRRNDVMAHRSDENLMKGYDVNDKQKIDTFPYVSMKEFSPLKENQAYQTLMTFASFPIESVSNGCEEDEDIEALYKNMTLNSSSLGTEEMWNNNQGTATSNIRMSVPDSIPFTTGQETPHFTSPLLSGHSPQHSTSQIPPAPHNTLQDNTSEQPSLHSIVSLFAINQPNERRQRQKRR